MNGRGDWIRTNDPLLPKQVRYQTALRPDTDSDAALLNRGAAEGHSVAASEPGQTA